MPAALYLRKSNPSDTAEISLDSQEAACRRWCAEQGIDVGPVYREVQSGVELWERECLQKLLEAARTGAFDTVVFYATDRLSRDPEHLTALKVLLGACDVQLACVTEPVPADATGALVTFLRGWASNREWEQIRERTVRGKRARAEQGLPARAGIPPYGYLRTEDGAALVIHEAQARVVREIVAWTAAGYSTRWIARALNARGEPVPSSGKAHRPGAVWGHSQVRKILSNPIYVGDGVRWRWHRYKRADGATVNELRDPAEWLRLAQDAAPALVDRQTWDEAQRALRANVGARTRNEARPWLLRGRVVCAVCGGRVSPECSKGRAYYRCTSRLKRAGHCGARMIPAEPLDAWVWQRVEAFLTRPAAAELIVRSQRQGDTTGLEAEIAALGERLAANDRAQARLLARYADSESVRWELIEAQITRLEAERRGVERHLAEIEQRLAHERRAVAEARSLAEQCRRLAEALPRLDVAGRAEVLAALGVTVTAAGRDPAGWSLAPGWLRGW